MKFLDRTEELAELRRVLNSVDTPRFGVVFGRRRLGKSTLIKKALSNDDIYYMAGDFVDTLQLHQLKDQLSVKFPDIALGEYTNYEDLLKMLNILTEEKFTLCLDEFPYMVKHSPELPSMLQRLIDSKELKFNIVICGSSQRMMQNMILSKSEPLYGRAYAILDIRPIPIAYLQEALSLSPVATIEEYSVWGGVPRYWELREDRDSLYSAISATLLSTTGVLYDEPKKIFLDDMTSIVQSESLMSVVASGANRLSEIAARMGREATALSAPIDRLIQMNYLRREVPFGDSPKKSKKGIYRINDPLMDFYYSFIIPNMSSIGRGRKGFVMEEIQSGFNEYVGRHWEHLCREAISGNRVYGHRWTEASRWWGTVMTADGPRSMEFDVVAESSDGSALLVGECKWTNPEVATELHRKLLDKTACFPYAKGKKIVPVLFLKHEPKDIDSSSDLLICYPQDVINMAYGEE